MVQLISKQTTVNQGGGSGGSVNLGSVAGALGIGGITRLGSSQ